MRRLWSYVILTGASLVLMGSTFANVFKRSTSNIEYSDGREMVFRISEKEDGVDLREKDDDGVTPAETISKSMIERLDSLNVTNYQVSTESYDTVKVTLKQDTDANYQNVENLMTFDGSLALSSKLDDFLDNSDEKEHFLTGKAFMETENNLPSVNIPVGDNFSTLYDIVKNYAQGETPNTDAAESETTGEGDDAKTDYHYYIYLWHDYEDGDTFSQTVEGNTDYDEHVAEKIFMKFDVQKYIDLENEDKPIENLTAYVNVQDVNGNEKYEASEVRKAFDTARYYVSLINCGGLDYKVTYLYSNNVSATTETLFGADGNLLWTATLRGTIICVAIISLLLVVFYRLSSLSVITTTIGSIFAGIASLILFTAEFNAAGLIALCAVAMASLTSGVIYLTKLKDEAYRGRSLKKANSEAAKKSLLPILDINVVLIIIGVFSYVFGSTIMRSFAIISVLGGIASLILNLLVLRGLMWLATNTTKLQGKYEYFGIDSKHVPNLLKEEKQTYFGSYAEKDFTKKKLPVGIIAGLLFVAGLVGMIVIGSLKNGVVYNNGGTLQNSEIFIETESKNTGVTDETVRQVLGTIYTYDKDESKAKKLSDQVQDIVYKTREDTDKDTDLKINYTYYVVKLNTKLDNSTINSYYVELDEEGKEIGERVYSDLENGGISTLISDRIQVVTGDSEVEANLKSVNLVSTQQPEFAPVIWGTLVGIAVSSFYLLLRYRLSRGLATFIVTTIVAGSVAGFFAYTFLAVTNYAVVVIPVVALFALFVSIIIMNRERELVLEDKTHDKSVENRQAIMVRATSLSYSTVLLTAILAVYIGINFFGFGPANNAWLYLILVVGVIVSVFFITTLLGPIGQLFYKLFSKINTEKIAEKFKRKKKKKVAPVVRSAEPEERTFIGIND